MSKYALNPYCPTFTKEPDHCEAWERQEQDAEHMKETMKIPSQGEEAQDHGQAQQEEI